MYQVLTQDCDREWSAYLCDSFKISNSVLEDELPSLYMSVMVVQNPLYYTVTAKSDAPPQIGKVGANGRLDAGRANDCPRNA